jgi:hypothetical protein
MSIGKFKLMTQGVYEMDQISCDKCKKIFIKSFMGDRICKTCESNRLIEIEMGCHNVLPGEVIDLIIDEYCNIEFIHQQKHYSKF